MQRSAFCDVCDHDGDKGGEEEPSNRNQGKFMRPSPDVGDETFEEFADSEFQHP